MRRKVVFIKAKSCWQKKKEKKKKKRAYDLFENGVPKAPGSE